MVRARACLAPGRLRWAIVASCVAACAPPERDLRLEALREREAALRVTYSPESAAPGIDVSGADPYRIVELASGNYVGLLRGAKAVVLLDCELVEISRHAFDEAPTSLAAESDETVFVGSRYVPVLTELSARAGGFERRRELAVASGIADLVSGQAGMLYVLLEDGRLVGFDAQRRPAFEYFVGRGGLRMLQTGEFLLVLSLFERALIVLELDARGAVSRERARIAHDAPLWGFDAVQTAAGLSVLAAGAEDRALSRQRGEFENIDSFLFAYQVTAAAERRAELNLSEHGLVTPKVVKLLRDPALAEPELRGLVLASGSGGVARITLSGDRIELEDAAPSVPGASDALMQGETLLTANPLFDAWTRIASDSEQLTIVDPATRSPSLARLGEALIFTELIAPHNRSDGGHSRFTCETCHWEGTVDGRMHSTGRGTLRVNTKPLLGLANNRPHFSRALDPDLSAVSHNEFRVAGAGSGVDAWFTLDARQFPWLEPLGIATEHLSPLLLREAFFSFLYGFSHGPNAAAYGRSGFTDTERRGAELFRARCEGCHAARLVSDDALSQVPFEHWEALTLSRNAPIVWARGDYERTGVLPYVHERGTRIPSLRRLALKARYFTSGSAASLEEVLKRFRYSGERAFHDGPATDGARSLQQEQQRALLAFLVLL